MKNTLTSASPAGILVRAGSRRRWPGRAGCPYREYVA